MISVTGPGAGGYGFGINTTGSVTASWTQSGAYTGVSVDAVLLATSPATGTAYLTNQIGPGTTAATRVIRHRLIVDERRVIEHPK